MATSPLSLYESLLKPMAQASQQRPPRASAAVVPWRRNSAGQLEVFWIRRARALRFMGGWHAFPGGGLSRSDATIEPIDLPQGISSRHTSEALPEIDGELTAALGSDLIPGLATCAARELFEETGLLLARNAAAIPSSSLHTARTRLLTNEVAFADLLAELATQIDAASLVFAGRWLTPPLAPLRFDNRFFLLEWPADQIHQPYIIAGELEHGEWIEPRRALARWRLGEVMAAPPILHILRVLDEAGPEAGLDRLRDPSEANLGPFRRVEFRPGVILLPLRTPTLLPATHTNAFLLGGKELVLIDPATPFAEETEHLAQAVDAALGQGHEIRAIWLTHHHPDHVGAVAAMRQHLGVPVCAHPLAVEPLARQGIRVDQTLSDSERVVLAGDPPFPVRICHTPGHTRGHLAFYDETYGSLIAGDLVSSLSTIVIDPPEGQMSDYLDSLAKMIELAPRTLFPAHGPAILQAVAKLEEFRRHRLEREAQILTAWRAGQRSAAAIVDDVYAEVPEWLHPVAERQVQAHLARLRSLGEIDGSGQDG